MLPLRRHREAAGLSQQTLADRVGLSRQAYGAIETGRATPGVDVALALARALATSVEQLFGGSAETTATAAVALADLAPGARVTLARCGDVVVAVPVPGASPARTADGRCSTGGPAGTSVPIEAFGDANDVARALADHVLVAGCALGLGVVADHLNADGGAGRFVWWPTSNAGARALLSRGLVHLAALHHGDDDDAPDHARATVTLGRWELGCVTRHDDRRVRTGDDLKNPALRLVHREAGAGAELVLRRLLGDADPGAGPVVGGHLDVARAIAFSAGDAGICAQDAALCLGLRFLPLREERVVLHAARGPATDVRVARYLEALGSRVVRRELDALGYDTRDSGTRVGA